MTTTEDPRAMRGMSRIRKIRPIEKTAREIRVPNHCLAYLCVRRNNWRSKFSAQFGITRKERPNFFWLPDRFLWFILTCVELDEQEAKNPGKIAKCGSFEEISSVFVQSERKADRAVPPTLTYTGIFIIPKNKLFSSHQIVFIPRSAQQLKN